MPISVTVKDLETGAPAWQAVLPEPVAKIGRNATCDLVLRDPERHVSRLHASIELRAGGYYLLVHSKINPVMVDGKPRQPDSATALHSGTVVVMYPFELTVRAERVAAQTADPAASDDDFAWVGVRHPPEFDADPFKLDLLDWRTQPAPPQPDRLWQPTPPRPPQLVDDIASNPVLDSPPSLDPLELLDKRGAGRTSSGALAEFPDRKREREDAGFAPDHVHDHNLPFNDRASAPPAPADLPANPAVPAPGATAVEAFLRGLGFPAFEVPLGQEEEFFEKAGEIMEVAVHCLVTLLLSRGEIKRELRAEERTMVAACANNPLKFVADGGEALRYLFDPSAAQPGAFLPPVKAIEEACAELVAHELGMLAGTRAAVIGAIKRFDPQAIVHNVASGRGFLAVQRKARFWEGYVEHHAKVQADMADGLDRVFELDFLAAYSEQVKRVTKK